MSLEQFVMFMYDSAVLQVRRCSICCRCLLSVNWLLPTHAVPCCSICLCNPPTNSNSHSTPITLQQTHVPHDENDEPLQEFRTLLDPVRLLTLVPRNYGIATNNLYSSLNSKLIEAAKQDKFLVTFSQFYQLLLIITQIVYADLFELDATLAVNKFLQVRCFGAAAGIATTSSPLKDNTTINKVCSMSTTPYYTNRKAFVHCLCGAKAVTSVAPLTY